MTWVQSQVCLNTWISATFLVTEILSGTRATHPLTLIKKEHFLGNGKKMCKSTGNVFLLAYFPNENLVIKYI